MAQPTFRPQGAYNPANTIDSLGVCKTPKAHCVSAQELQARIKAARKTKAALHTPPATAHPNPRQPHEPAHTSSHSKVTPSEQRRRSARRYDKNQGPLCIDTVIARLQTETGQPNPKAQHGQKHILQFHGGVAANEYPSAHRPQSYRTASSRSSMISRKSPLSTVCLPEEYSDLSVTDSSRSSSQSSSSSCPPNNGPANDVLSEALHEKLSKRRNGIGSAVSPPAQPRKSKLSWLSLTRRSHVSAV
ncbi:hypothetical protein J1614_008447 [Plenodomus biglobosus]|nr:hypothetical protein J1614_008447 [Plenodomus biglobosus]